MELSDNDLLDLYLARILLKHVITELDREELREVLRMLRKTD